MWTQYQEDHAFDYIRRLRECYTDKPEKVTGLIERLRMSQEEGLERRDVWLEMCRIMSDTPDLRVEFKNFMAAGDGPF
ncbi:hypothetical protein VE03_06920 [Pseudogymnoascus sp. 23342-1-I1]|nr:hypothetical protein VE03_06920 [Pseudogymnoascus sp. 23342-1-I1]